MSSIPKCESIAFFPDFEMVQRLQQNAAASRFSRVSRDVAREILREANADPEKLCF